MIANYHTHTWRCKHATGTEREYVENAIEGGIKILGFSDHSPMPNDDGYVSPVKMTFQQVDDYVTTVLDLKKEYASDIEIHLGMEVEYFPKYFNRMREQLKDYPIEYFLLGEHFLDEETPEFFYTNHPSDDEQRFIHYCDQVKEAVETGAFTYLAHPDLFRYTGPDEIYEKHYRDLCEYMKQKEMLLEINLLGIRENRSYPDERFWKIAGEVGNSVILGSDAHQPNTVWSPEAEKKANEIVSANQLKLVQTVDLVSPFQNM